ncbi:scabin-related ADP-ribosyltransferase, partial [Streptomyces sp. NPDC005122]
MEDNAARWIYGLTGGGAALTDDQRRQVTVFQETAALLNLPLNDEDGVKHLLSVVSLLHLARDTYQLPVGKEATDRLVLETTGQTDGARLTDVYNFASDLRTLRLPVTVQNLRALWAVSDLVYRDGGPFRQPGAEHLAALAGRTPGVASARHEAATAKLISLAASLCSQGPLTEEMLASAAVGALVGEIGAYLDARGPSPSERVWQGSDGRERCGNAEEWHEWIKDGERLRFALTDARKRVREEVQRILDQAPDLDQRLDDELRRLMAELQLGETGELESSTLSAPQLPPRPRSADVDVQVGWIRKVVETLRKHLDTMDVHLDPTGDAVGNVAGDTGPSAAWLEGLRLFQGITGIMRNLEETVAPRTDVLAVVDQGKVNADADQVEADAKLLVQKLVKVSHFLQGPAFQRPSSWESYPRDGQFSLDVAMTDLPRTVSAVMPPYALEAAVQDVDISELRLMASSVASQGLFWRIDRNRLYRSDKREPEDIFRNGFKPRETDLLSDLKEYVELAYPTNLVSTSRSAALAANWNPGNYVYEIDARGGLDMVATMGRLAWVKEQEVVFLGGLKPQSIVGAWRPDGTFIKNQNYRAPTVDSEIPLASVEELGESSVRFDYIDDSGNKDDPGQSSPPVGREGVTSGIPGDTFGPTLIGEPSPHPDPNNAHDTAADTLQYPLNDDAPMKNADGLSALPPATGGHPDGALMNDLPGDGVPQNPGAGEPGGSFIRNENYRAPTVDSEMPLVSVEVLGKSSVRGAGG